MRDRRRITRLLAGLRMLERTPADLARWCRPWYGHRRRLLRRAARGADLARILATDGQMTGRECEVLYDLARAATGGCIVEIGSYHGRSTVALALGTRAGANLPVYAIDPFLPAVGALGGTFAPSDKVVFLQNLLLADVVEQVWLVQLQSSSAAQGWKDPVALLWVDGDHTYPGVTADVGCWSSRVIPGGIVAFHDSVDPRLGPVRVIADLLRTGGYERLSVVETVTVLQKRATRESGARPLAG